MDTGALADAIRSRKTVELVYGSEHGGGTRIVNPHVLYRTSSGGLCLDAVQLAGATASHDRHWRQFHLMKIAEVRVLNNTFQVADDFDPRADKYSAGVLASV